MEMAALWVAIVAAIASGASAIVAWTARADSLRAQDAAGSAEASALEVSRQALEAMREANLISAASYQDTAGRSAHEKRYNFARAVKVWWLWTILDLEDRVAAEAEENKARTKMDRRAGELIPTDLAPDLLAYLSRVHDKLWGADGQLIAGGDTVSACYQGLESIDLWVSSPAQFCQTVVLEDPPPVAVIGGDKSPSQEGPSVRASSRRVSRGD